MRTGQRSSQAMFTNRLALIAECDTLSDNVHCSCMHATHAAWTACSPVHSGDTRHVLPAYYSSPLLALLQVHLSS